jgi:hypothetical protein
VTDKDGKPIGVALLSKQDAKYFTMREGGPTVFETRDYMYTRLDKQARDFEQGTTPTTVAPAAAPGGGAMVPLDLGLGGDDQGGPDEGGPDEGGGEDGE